MGNVAARPEEAQQVDGGLLFPTGQVYKKTECDLRVARKLIKERRLAPFYVGEADEGERAPAECPICFLYYPPNTNRTRCCQQIICTECFLQIKQPVSGGPAVCPFCVQPDLAVWYEPPTASEGAAASSAASASPSASPNEALRKRSMSLSGSHVTVDLVRPNGRHFPPPRPAPAASSSSAAASAADAARRASMSAGMPIQAVRTSRTRRTTNAFLPASSEEHRPHAWTPSPSNGSSSRPSAHRSPQHPSHRLLLLQAASYSAGDALTARTAADIEEMMLREAIRLSLQESPSPAPSSTTTRSQQDDSSDEDLDDDGEHGAGDDDVDVAELDRRLRRQLLFDSGVREHDSDSDDDKRARPHRSGGGNGGGGGARRTAAPVWL